MTLSSTNRTRSVCFILMLLSATTVSTFLYLQMTHELPKYIEQDEKIGVKIENTQVEENNTDERFLDEREQEYKERQKRIQKVCDYYRIMHPDIYRSISEVSSILLTQSDKFHLLWTQVPKAGSRSWVHNFEILRNNGNEEMRLDALIKTKEKVRNIVNSWKTWNDNGFLSFAFSRHPFARVLSTYRDKMLYISSVSWKKASLISRRIAAQYRSEAMKKKNNQTNCTFPEFVEYLINEGVEENIHWRPASSLMYPCGLQYDVPGKLETFDQDSNYVIKKMKLENLIQVVRKNDKKLSDYDAKKHFFGSLSRNHLDGLYHRYEPDFLLFGYSADEYYKLLAP